MFLKNCEKSLLAWHAVVALHYGICCMCSCVVDIDECEEETYSCPKYSRCKNKNGGYDCPCKDGFEETAQGTCAGNALYFILFCLMII